MADQKLSALSSASVASGNDLFYMVTTAGVSQKINFTTLKSSLSLPTYAGTGNKYIMTDTGADTVSSFRLVQSGNSITISTAGNNIVITALTGNLSTKQDTITYPLGINSGGTGITATGSATSLVGMNSSGSVYDYFALKASDNLTIVRSGNNYFFSANTGTGASTSGIIYAPTGGFYVSWSNDTLLANEKILTASNNITITTSATAIFISANTGSGGSGDITSVGNVASGAAFDGVAGDTLTFFEAGTPGLTGYAWIRLNSSANSLGAPTPVFLRNFQHDFHFGDDTGSHMVIAPDQGWIISYGDDAGDNAGLTAYTFKGGNSQIALNGANGIGSSPVISSANDIVGIVSFSGYDGSNYQEVSDIFGTVDGVVTAGSAPGRLEFYTTNPVGTAVKRLKVDRNGLFFYSSSGGFDTTINVHRSTASRTIFLPDSSGTFAVASVYPAKLDSGGLISVDTAFLINSGRTLIAGTGLAGGGDLSADRTFSVNTNVRDKTYGFFGAGNISTTMLMEEARYFIPFNMEARACYVSATTAPTGANIIINLNQWNAGLTASTGMFASANRPNIAASAFVGSSLTFDIGTLYQGSWLGVSVDQCGSTNAGSNLTITLISRSS